MALLVYRVASTSVGAYTGQIVMGGFLRYNVPVLVRRLITLAPSLAVLCSGVSPTKALVLSQVVLSFGIPFALLPLILFTRDKTLMGAGFLRHVTLEHRTQNTDYRRQKTSFRITRTEPSGTRNSIVLRRV
ncbi:divalent metal cation transporter [Streptomyces chartreusis]|uniref:divalent metal cation transporter n=1 Tax=Streptomyces chartreusis TaxID=1969 RepID=UPI00371509A2